ncbi:hypothetical protein TESG_00350 [Trichophyton tonsurans CBS 112818]|uniref:Uncharacterized protein n=1 Tax=Trichophyton tonsurans (strain CBS 112818) TaxID=647933 RepID=F2RN84_TRIT1|nr:hypothetical protein TESG_00350 [Trichophyton tonsurans CBS 112818]
MLANYASAMVLVNLWSITAATAELNAGMTTEGNVCGSMESFIDSLRYEFVDGIIEVGLWSDSDVWTQQGDFAPGCWQFRQEEQLSMIIGPKPHRQQIQ